MGAMRISRIEALDIINEKKNHSDLSIVMEVDLHTEERRICFKCYRNCAINHYASYLYSTKCMRAITGNSYTIAGVQGTFREHTIDIEGTIVESVLGLGAIFGGAWLQRTRRAPRNSHRAGKRIEEPTAKAQCHSKKALQKKNGTSTTSSGVSTMCRQDSKITRSM
eukprot:5252082-Heterocapsa_arctica.AAC.1